MDIGEEFYLVGPMIFFRIDRDGYTVSLQVADLYQLAAFLEEHSVILMQGGESFVAIRWTDHVDGRGIFCGGRLVRLFRRSPDAGGKGG